MGLEGWEEGMTNRVPIDAGVLGLSGDEESSVFSLESEREDEEEARVQGIRRAPASIRE
jgi:hypothetical protein